METNKISNYKSTIVKAAKAFLPNLSINCVILGFHDGILKVLLNRMDTTQEWRLTGGFVYLNEDVNDAAYRITCEKTGLDEIYPEQFYLFGNADRVYPNENKYILTDGFTHPKGRFINIGYYTLVPYSQIEINEAKSHIMQWFHIYKLPNLFGDHNKIVAKTIESIRERINSIPLGYRLLSEKFTMSDLRLIYESLLNRTLDRRNFQRKMLASGFIYKLEEVSRKWGSKSASLFSFDIDKYDSAVRNGTVFNEW